MSWSHKGIDINIDQGGRFTATVGDLQVVADNLKEAQDQIELCIKKNKSNKSMLDLPCLVYRIEDGEVSVISTRVRGISGTDSSLRVSNPDADLPRFGHGERAIYPDHPAVAMLLSELEALDNLRVAVVRKLEPLQLKTNVGWGRLPLGLIEGACKDWEATYKAALKKAGER